MEELINEISKTELAKEMGLSRQGLYNKIKAGHTEEIYQAALKIKEKQNKIIEKNKDKEKIKKLENEIKSLKERIRELKTEIVLYKNQEKYKQQREEYLELEKKYINLRARYTNQNEELIRLKVMIGGSNDNSRSK